MCHFWPELIYSRRNRQKGFLANTRTRVPCGSGKRTAFHLAQLLWKAALQSHCPSAALDCHGSAPITQRCETLLNRPCCLSLVSCSQGLFLQLCSCSHVSLADADSFQSPVTEGGFHAGRALLVHLQCQEFSPNTLVTLSLPESPGVPALLNGCAVLLHCSLPFPCYSTAVCLSWVLHGA